MAESEEEKRIVTYMGKDMIQYMRVCVLTLVCIVLDLELQLPRVGLHPVHHILQVLLILLMSVLKLNELLLRRRQ